MAQSGREKSRNLSSTNDVFIFKSFVFCNHATFVRPVKKCALFHMRFSETSFNCVDLTCNGSIQSERINCGSPTISKTLCEALGCCYAETNLTLGNNRCFHKALNSLKPATDCCLSTATEKDIFSTATEKDIFSTATEKDIFSTATEKDIFSTATEKDIFSTASKHFRYFAKLERLTAKII